MRYLISALMNIKIVIRRNIIYRLLPYGLHHNLSMSQKIPK